MALYICPDCGQTFDQPGEDVHDHESWMCCPECGSPDFERTHQCVCCGEDYTYSDLIAGKLCRECLDAESFGHDYYDFAHDPACIESFAEFMVEKHGEIWKQRRLKPFMKEEDD